MRRSALCIVGALTLAGCSLHQPDNDSFRLSLSDAEAAWKQMAAHPAPLPRPVVVLSGIFDSGDGSDAVASHIRDITTSDDQVISIEFVGAHTFDQCAQRTIDAIDARFPSDDPTHTTEVDIVACSMGGLVARYASSQNNHANTKRLRIARLFTISTPHRGAKLAPAVASIDKRIECMRPGSPFLAALDAQKPDYQIIPYVRLDDGVVGEENSAPPGQTAWWVPNKPFNSAHMSAKGDSRILADIARRLRGEMPFTTEPAADLPPKHFLVRSIDWNESRSN